MLISSGFLYHRGGQSHSSLGLPLLLAGRSGLPMGQEILRKPRPLGFTRKPTVDPKKQHRDDAWWSSGYCGYPYISTGYCTGYCSWLLQWFSVAHQVWDMHTYSVSSWTIVHMQYRSFQVILALKRLSINSYLLNIRWTHIGVYSGICYLWILIFSSFLTHFTIRLAS